MTDRDLTPDPLRDARYGVGMQAGYVGFDTDAEAYRSNVDAPKSSPWNLFAGPLFLALCIALGALRSAGVIH